VQRRTSLARALESKQHLRLARARTRAVARVRGHRAEPQLPVRAACRDRSEQRRKLRFEALLETQQTAEALIELEGVRILQSLQDLALQDLP
jgi:hypothetical protein